MSLFDKVASFFDNSTDNSTKKPQANDKVKKKKNKKFDKKYNRIEIGDPEVWKMVDIAKTLKRSGNFKTALEYYNQIEKGIDFNPKVSAGKAKVLILTDNIKMAYKEYIKILRWFKNNIDSLERFDSVLKANCYGSFEHIGYCKKPAPHWIDSKEYLLSLAGKATQKDLNAAYKRMIIALNETKSREI